MSPAAPRVLHVTTTAMSLEWLLKPQLLAFSRAGFDVATASAPGVEVEGLVAAGIAHYEVPSFQRSVDALADLRSIPELSRAIARFAPDILHTHNPKPGVIGRILGRATGVPIVVNTVHGLYAQRSDRWSRRAPVYAAERFAAAFSDAELVQSVEDVETLTRLGVPRSKLHALGNGIDLGRFQRTVAHRRRADELRASLGIAPTTPIVGVVSRLVWEKGYRDVFDAVRALRQNGTEAAFVVVGPGELGKADAVDEASIAEMKRLGVHFLGSRSDVADLLAMFDVFLLGSRREGFPRAAMEAAAMGVPVVATDIRGCRQVVDHGHNGYLYRVGDVETLVHQLETLLARPALRRSFAVRGVERAAAEFDQNRVIDRTLGVYRSLMVEKFGGYGRAASSRYSPSIDLVADEASKDAAEAVAPAASR